MYLGNLPRGVSRAELVRWLRDGKLWYQLADRETGETTLVHEKFECDVEAGGSCPLDLGGSPTKRELEVAKAREAAQRKKGGGLGLGAALAKQAKKKDDDKDFSDLPVGCWRDKTTGNAVRGEDDMEAHIADPKNRIDPLAVARENAVYEQFQDGTGRFYMHIQFAMIFIVTILNSGFAFKIIANWICMYKNENAEEGAGGGGDAGGGADARARERRNRQPDPAYGGAYGRAWVVVESERAFNRLIETCHNASFRVERDHKDERVVKYEYLLHGIQNKIK